MLQYFIEIFINQQQGIGRVITDGLLSICVLLLFYDFRKIKNSLGIFFALIPAVLVLGIFFQSLWYLICSTFSFPQSSAFILPSALLLLTVGFTLRGDKGRECLMRGLMFYSIFMFSVNIFFLLNTNCALQVTCQGLFIVANVIFLRLYHVDLRFEKSYIFLILFGGAALLGIVIESFYYLLILNEILDENYHNSVYKTNMIICICLYLLYLIMYVTFVMLVKYYKRTQTIQEENFRMKLSEESATLKEKSYSELSSLRHDLKNQLSYVSLLAEQEEYHKLKTYINELYEGVSKSGRHCNTENHAIGVALDMEITKAEEKQIPVSVSVRVARDLPIKDIDLCSLFTNLMDNAIEAIEKSGCEDRLLSVSVSQIRGYLCIKVKNRTWDLPDGEYHTLNTDKAEKEKHGWGTKIVRRISEKYDGYASFRIENGYFIADVMLKLDDEIKEIDDAKYQTGNM